MSKPFALRWAWPIFTFTLLGFATASAHAARVAPPPLITQFDEGHGVVLATIVKIEPTAPRKDELGQPRMTFHVDEVIAAPTVDDAWGLAVGSTFALTTSVGYGSSIETWLDGAPLPKHPANPPKADPGWGPAVGSRFIIAIRRDAKASDGYRTTHGTDAAKAVRELDPQRRREIVAVREQAALTGEPRLARCRAVLGDNAQAFEVRRQAICYLQQYAFYSGYPPRDAKEAAAREAERKATADALWAAFTDPAGAWTDELLPSFDYALREVDFKVHRDDDRRRAALVKRLVQSPPVVWPADEEGQRRLMNRPLHLLDEAAGSKPEQITKPIIEALDDQRWSLLYRRSLMLVLNRLRETSADDRALDTPVLAFVTRALAAAGGYELRVLAGDAAYLIGEGKSRSKRPIPPTAEFLASLAAAEQRAASKSSTDSQFAMARDQLHSLLRSLAEKPTSPTGL